VGEGGPQGIQGGTKKATSSESANRKQTQFKRVDGRGFSIGYNPISHAYEDSSRGQALRSYDETKEVNRYVRSKNIVEKNNANFNIITG
jgi:hypothetical protein